MAQHSLIKWDAWHLTKSEQAFFRTIHRYCIVLDMRTIADDVCALYLRHRSHIKRYPDSTAAALVYMLVKATRPDWSVVDVASRLRIPASSLNAAVSRLKHATVSGPDAPTPLGDTDDSSSSGELREDVLINRLTPTMHSIVWPQQAESSAAIPRDTQRDLRRLTRRILALAKQNGLAEGRSSALLVAVCMLLVARTLADVSSSVDPQFRQLSQHVGYCVTSLKNRSKEVKAMLADRAALLYDGRSKNTLSLDVLEDILSDEADTYVAHMQRCRGSEPTPPAFAKSQHQRRHQEQLIKEAKDLLRAPNDTAPHHDDDGRGVPPEVRMVALLLDQGVAEDEIRSLRPDQLQHRLLQTLRVKPDHDLDQVDLDERDMGDQELKEYIR